MSSPVISENLFLLYSLGMGIFITFIYDIFRIWRRICIHNSFFVSLEDIFFWIFCAVSVFYLMHTQSNGTLRWFAVLGALTGMLLYKKTVSPFFVKWVSFILKAVLHFLLKIIKIAGTPFSYVIKKCKKAGVHAKNRSRRTAGFFKKRLTAFVKMLKMILCKQ
ncbi:MAG: spore cortex biosynthesis protein YabQ [Lachnospiraceae bacterium]|mgnify:CR=1 FL=1|nr:spore cortex biosynthesis protein YabQ [Lachnospiraceae bacterium]